MHIRKINIKNFRLLQDVELFLEEQVTVIVGRNNSGKTSLTELFRRLLSEQSPVFRLEDFSLATHEQFWNAFVLRQQGGTDDTVRKTLPFIEVRLTVRYAVDSPDFGPLADFVIDLNPDCAEAVIVIRHQLKEGEIDDFFESPQFEEQDDEDRRKERFFRAIKERIPKYYSTSYLAEDPGDPTNQKALEWSKARALLWTGFIDAQRGLDNTTHKDVNVLGKILESLLTSAMCESADPRDRDVAQRLTGAVEGIQKEIRDGFDKHVQGLFPTLSVFGYPGLSDPHLLTETTLDVERLLKNHTRVNYSGVHGINLPETYNGLGVRNLIFILLKLLELFKSFAAAEMMPGVHLVFIEEPEVHLHPQMQEVFINNIGSIVAVFAREFHSDLPWPVQFVITTHSSHVANKAPFESIRYFLSTHADSEENTFATRVKDLRTGLTPSSAGMSAEDREFLHKYMTLTRCDLLFADRAVLIEGTAERLVLPRMIEKIDAQNVSGAHLSSQYVSIVEVGGAYAHRFFRLLEFLELRTLVITDLDAVKKNESERYVACPVSEGTGSSNECIKRWFAGKTPGEGQDGERVLSPADLIQKSDEERTHGICRIAYQVPEANGAPCGRTFEDAFILANPDLFGLTLVPREKAEIEAREKASEIKKTDFALEYAIEKTGWTIPRYIADGLRWLSEGACGPAATLALPSSPPTGAASDSSKQEELHD